MSGMRRILACCLLLCAAGAAFMPAPAGAAPLPAPFLWTGLQLVDQPSVSIPINPLKGAKAYRLLLSAKEDFSSTILEAVLDTPVLRFSNLPDGDYFVRLRGVDDKGVEGLDATARMRVRLLPVAPTPGHPADRTRLRGGTLQFDWEAQPQAVEYRLQLARDRSFRDLVGDWAGLQAPRHQATDIPPGSFFWRVAYTQSDGKRSAFSTPRTIQLKPLPLPPYPAKIEEEVIVLAWPAEPGQNFEVQLAADAAFTQLLEERKTSEPTASLPRPEQGVYHARVRAIDADGTVGPFALAPPINVPKRPPKPVCLLPGPGGACAVYAPRGARVD